MDDIIRVLKPPQKGRQNAFWYEGIIAVGQYAGRRLELLACGDVRVRDRARRCEVNLADLADEAQDDAGLDRLVGLEGGFDHRPYEWINNSWFEVIEVLGGQEGGPSFTYDDALAELKELTIWHNRLVCPNK